MTGNIKKRSCIITFVSIAIIIILFLKINANNKKSQKSQILFQNYLIKEFDRVHLLYDNSYRISYQIKSNPKINIEFGNMICNFAIAQIMCFDDESLKSYQSVVFLFYRTSAHMPWSWEKQSNWNSFECNNEDLVSKVIFDVKENKITSIWIIKKSINRNDYGLPIYQYEKIMDSDWECKNFE